MDYSKKAIIALALTLGSWSAYAGTIVSKTTDQYGNTAIVEKLAEVAVTEANAAAFLGVESDCSKIRTFPSAVGVNGKTNNFLDLPEFPGSGTPDSDNNVSTGNPTLDSIINLGKAFWNLIQANAPVVSARTAMAHALPRGIRCWDELEGWKGIRVTTYGFAYVNKMGKEMVKFNYRLMYGTGGSYKGKGAYITNATIQPAEMSVKFGMVFNVDVTIPQVMNVGTSVDPIAAMEIDLSWNVKSKLFPVNDQTQSTVFVVYGDGRKHDSY